jgi:hypothetical protein
MDYENLKPNAFGQTSSTCLQGGSRLGDNARYPIVYGLRNERAGEVQRTRIRIERASVATAKYYNL